MGLFLPGDGSVEVLLEIAGEVFEFGRRCRRVAFVNNSGVLLGEAVETKLLVDVQGLLWQELRQLLSEVVMVGAGVNDQVFVEQNVTDGVLCEHPLDRASHHLIRMLFH